MKQKICRLKKGNNMKKKFILYINKIRQKV